MFSLLAKNLDRPFVKGAVFNGAEVVLQMAVREETGTRLYESHELNLLSGAIWVACSLPYFFEDAMNPKSSNYPPQAGARGRSSGHSC